MTAKEKATPLHPEQNVVGSHLQFLREEKGLSIEDVADVTKISASNLRAMENQQYDLLPADTFTRGHLTIYGEFLGVDGKQLALRFLTERDEKHSPGKRNKRNFDSNGRNLIPKKLAEPSHIPSATVAVLLLFCIVASFTTFCIYTSWNPFSYFTNTTKQFSASMMEVFKPGKVATNTAEEETLPLVLTATFTRETEVTVSINDQLAEKQSYKQNDQMQWQADKTLRLEFNRPDSAILLFNGKAHPFPKGKNGLYTLQLSLTSIDQ